MQKEDRLDCQHYYLRDKDNIPFACVAITPMGPEYAEGTIARGIAICSDLDQWNKNAARGKAIGRALKAKETGNHSEQCVNLDRPVVSQFLHQYGDAYRSLLLNDHPTCEVTAVFKSTAVADPTDREKRILSFIKERIASQAE